MLIRSTVDRLLPLKEGEKRLSKAERSFALRGRYLGRKITHAEVELDPSKRSERYKDSKNISVPVSYYHHIVTRKGLLGIEHKSGRNFAAIHRRPENEVANSINSYGLPRIQRVENMAKAVKTGVAALAVTAVAVFTPSLPDITLPDLPFGQENTGALIDSALRAEPQLQALPEAVPQA